MTTGNRSYASKLTGNYRLYSHDDDHNPGSWGSFIVPLPLYTIGKNWNGTDDPQWRSKVRVGADASHPYTMTETRFTERSNLEAFASYQYKYWWGTGTRSFSGITPFIRGLSLSPPASDQAVVNQALYRWYSKASDAIRPFQGGVFAGEALETVKLLVSPGKALRELLGQYLTSRRFRQLKLAAPKMTRENILVAASDAWLEGTLGWLPVINDIKAAYETLNKPQRLSTVVRAGMKKELNGTFQRADGGIHASIWCKQTVKGKQFIHVKVVGCLDLESVYPPGRLPEWGLSPRDIPLTVWELIPGSFLVDYFFNIGKVIEAYTFRRGSIKWANMTVARGRQYDLTSQLYVLKTVEGAFVPFNVETPKQGKLTLRSVSVTRSVGVPLPTAQHFTLPGSAIQWTNIASLLTLAKYNRSNRFQG